jgi:hypothetical protein
MSYNAVGIWTHTCLKHCIYQASLVHKGRRYDLHFREAVGYCLTRPETFWRRFLCTRSPKIRSFSFVSQFPTVQRLFHAYLLHSFSWTQLSSILVKLSEAAIRTKILRNSQYKTMIVAQLLTVIRLSCSLFLVLQTLSFFLILIRSLATCSVAHIKSVPLLT